MSLRASPRLALALGALTCGAIACSAGADVTALDGALKLLPDDTAAFVLVPNPKQASDDLQQCIERMDRPEAGVAGRPIDQLKAYLKIGASFDDKAPLALAMVSRGDALVPLAFVPVTDGNEFLKSNFTPLPDVGADAFKHADGTTVYARVLAHHVLMSTDADAVRGFKPADGLAERVRQRLGPRGAGMLARGDVVAWAGPAALTRAAKEAGGRRVPVGIPQADAMEAAVRQLMGEVSDALIAIDFDPLGVGVRTFALATKDSELSRLAAGGKNHGTRFDRLPRAPFYGIVRVDIDGLGGLAAAEAIVKKFPGAPTLPGWLVAARDHVHGLQFGVYPSKLGIATGGILNDSLLFIESDRPDAVRDGIKQAIMATAGEFAGIKREPTWTADKELKGGGTADAFEVKESSIPGAEQTSGAAIAKLVSQMVFGSRGFVGFVKPLSGGVALTFSQRVDVLERGVQASAGGKTFADDPTLASYRAWLVDGADVEAYVGIAQFGKLVQQLVTMVPGGQETSLPQIPSNAEPIAFAMEVDGGAVETATVLPTSLLIIVYDQMKQQRIGGAPTHAPAQ